nr:hypothetical protein [Tanacetum cinerariifolium]
MANVYPDVHGSLKFPADEHVILEEPLSSSETLSSIKSLDDAYIIGDLFLNDKPSKDELGKLNVDLEVVSMVIVPIHRASSLIPPLSTAIIDLSPPKPESMKWANRDEFLDEKDKSRKGRRDDQDPPLATQIQIQAEENTADYNEYKILEADFKNLHLNDFEDLYYFIFTDIRKRIEDLNIRIESYQTKLNLTQPYWDAFDFLFKEEYTIVSKPKAIINRDRNDQQKMIRRSKEFIEVIEHRLKIRRIFRSLESFVGERLRDVDYRLIQRTE